MAARSHTPSRHRPDFAKGSKPAGTREELRAILARADEPLSAYELLHRLETLKGRKVAPPTVYRALEALIAQKRIARIESRNAYVTCAHADHPHDCVFFVCDECHASTEIEDAGLQNLISRRARSLGFRITHRVIELTGLCGRCRGTPSHA